MPHVLKWLSASGCLTLALAAHGATVDTDTVIGPGSPLNGAYLDVVAGAEGPTVVRIVEGGTVAGLTILDDSEVIIDGGATTSIIGLGDSAKLTVLDGDLSCTENICQADFDGLIQANHTASVEFRGGDFNFFWMRLRDTSTLTVVGDSLTLTSSRGTHTVRGNYFDGTEVNLRADFSGDPAGRIFLVPEPSAAISTLVAMIVASQLGLRDHRLGCS